MLQELIGKYLSLDNEVKYIDASIKDLLPKSQEKEDLKKKRREISAMIREIENDEMEEIAENEEITNFRKDRLKKEEEKIDTLHQIFEIIKKENKDSTFSIDTEEGKKHVSILSLFHLFLNGKEVKNSLFQQKLPF